MGQVDDLDDPWKDIDPGALTIHIVRRHTRTPRSIQSIVER
jgi:hypothetical protein